MKAMQALAKIKVHVDKLRALNADIARGNFNNVGDISVQIGNTVGEIEQTITAAEEDEKAADTADTKA